MEKVISRDGTPIAYYRGGTGPPLVLVHGSSSANPSEAWTEVVPALERHFTVYAPDRRGYGESGDGPAYALAREAEDIAAVIDAAGDPAFLLGHSFGGLCALEAALLSQTLRKLVLYEPALPLPGSPVYPEGVTERLQGLLDASDREGILTALFDALEMPPEELGQLKASPLWPSRLARAHNIPRESLAEEAYRLEPERFKDLSTPTLLLLGGDSPTFFEEVTAALGTALSESRIAVLPGQGHLAMYTAPKLFVGELLKFLLRT